MSTHKVIFVGNEAHVHKVLSDGHPASMPTMKLSFDEARELGRDLIVGALTEQYALDHMEDAEYDPDTD